MCGRYVSASSPGEIADYFGATAVDETLSEPNYNVAPTTDVPVIRVKEDARHLGLCRWGLVPFWAKSIAIGNKMTNARVETILEKSAFRNAATRRRCIVPADAFYEWTAVKSPTSKKPLKQPWCIQRNDGAPFAFAGLYESWRDPEGDGSKIVTCTIITGPANEAMQAIHDRMPVMIQPARWDDWLDPSNEDAEALLDSLEAPPAELFNIYAVSTAVNNSRSTGAELLDEVDPMTEASLAALAAAEADAGEQGTLL